MQSKRVKRYKKSLQIVDFYEESRQKTNIFFQKNITREIMLNFYHKML